MVERICFNFNENTRFTNEACVVYRSRKAVAIPRRDVIIRCFTLYSSVMNKKYAISHPNTGVYALYQSNNGSLGMAVSRSDCTTRGNAHASFVHAARSRDPIRGKQILMRACPVKSCQSFKVCYWKQFRLRSFIAIYNKLLVSYRGEAGKNRKTRFPDSKNSNFPPIIIFLSRKRKKKYSTRIISFLEFLTLLYDFIFLYFIFYRKFHSEKSWKRKIGRSFEVKNPIPYP